MRGRVLAGTAAILLLALAVPGRAGAQAVADGVLAVVGDVPILVSDLRLAEAVRLAPQENDLDRWGAALLDARIRLELEYQDLTVGGLARRRMDTASAMARLLEAGGGREAVLARIAPYGLGLADLEELALRVAAVEEAIHVRFEGAIHVSDEEIRSVYASELAPAVRRRGKTPPPLETVRDDVRRLVAERKLNRRLEAWLAEARTRFPVVRYRPWRAEAGLAAAP